MSNLEFILCVIVMVICALLLFVYICYSTDKIAEERKQREREELKKDLELLEKLHPGCIVSIKYKF